MNSTDYVADGVYLEPFLENWNIVIDLSAMLLGDTLRNPNNVTAFLLLQLQVRIEYTEMELLNESEHIQFDLSMGNVEL